MITCQTATERLVAHWNAPTPQVTQEVQAAIEHVHDCPRCAGRLCALIGVLSANVETALNCNESTASLPCKVQAGQNQVREEARWQPAPARSTGCPYCKVARAELAALLDLACARRGQQAEDTPAPDLAFLHPDRSEETHPEQAS